MRLKTLVNETQASSAALETILDAFSATLYAGTYEPLIHTMQTYDEHESRDR